MELAFCARTHNLLCGSPGPCRWRGSDHFRLHRAPRCSLLELGRRDFQDTLPVFQLEVRARQIETIGDAYWCSHGLSTQATPADARRMLRFAAALCKGWASGSMWASCWVLEQAGTAEGSLVSDTFRHLLTEREADSFRSKPARSRKSLHISGSSSSAESRLPLESWNVISWQAASHQMSHAVAP